LRECFEKVYFRKLFALVAQNFQTRSPKQKENYGEDRLIDNLARRGRRSAYKLIMLQATVTGLASTVFFVMQGVNSGLSALAGAVIAVIPNFVFATLAFSHMGASATAKVLKGFYWGEAVKLLLTIALFSLVFLTYKAAFMPLFVCYLLGLIVHWTAPLYFKQS
jgi:ATP synthase protein I